MAADIIELRFEEIFKGYERRLRDAQSVLVDDKTSYEELKVQARSILDDVASDLRQEKSSGVPQERPDPSAEIGISRALSGVHPSESLRAVTALTEATLSQVIEELPPSKTSRTEVAEVALTLQRHIMERVARASVTYGTYLLGRLQEAHTDERRRIARELHDRVAHSIMVSFRSLELYELYEKQDASRAREKFALAKKTAQEALKTTRTLSFELRHSVAEEGLEVALSEYLREVVPSELEAEVAVEGAESHVPSQVRDEVFLILREAIRNAVAHSESEKLGVWLNITPNWIRATVKDEGGGFDPEKVAASSQGTGLKSMEERTKLLGGDLDLVSIIGDGTKVAISVPLPGGPS